MSQTISTIDLSSGTDIDFDFGESNFNQSISESLTIFDVGDLIKAKVLEIGSDFVLLEAGYKSQGMVPKNEFLDEEDRLTINVGDEVEIYLENIENSDGQIVVSKEKAQKLRIWENVGKVFDADETIQGKIVSKIKGGLVVDLGVKAFLPGSQIDLRPVRNPDKLLEETFDFKILKYNLKRGNIVLSRRAYLEIDKEDRRKKTIETLKEGALVIGHVKNITDYGLFIDLGGIDGLLHITDMTWGRITHPTAMYNIGDEIEVIVLSYDEALEKVSLGLKQKSLNPWDNITEKFNVGDKVKGRVVNIMSYGAFIEIEEGVEGLIHVSEMSWTKKIKHPSSYVQLDDEVEAVIKEINMEKKRISLSIRDIQSNPWKEILEATPPGTVVEGKVKNITDFGVFVEIGEDIDGLVHVSDISWSQRVKKAEDVLERGSSLNVKILGIDVEKGRLSLGIKQLTDDPWKNLENEISIGDEVQGKVVHIADFGVFVEIKEGVEGLVHISETGSGANNKKTLLQKFPLNGGVIAKVLKVDAIERKLGLAIASEEEEITSYESDKKDNKEKAEEKAGSDLNAEPSEEGKPVESAKNTEVEASAEETTPNDNGLAENTEVSEEPAVVDKAEGEDTEKN